MVFTNNSINTNSSSDSTSCSVNSSYSGSPITSTDSASFSDPYNLSFITDNKTSYYQLLEDLSIIDCIQDTFYETESNVYDKQIIETEKHISLKQKLLDTLIELENCYIQDFQNFEAFGTHLKAWLNDKNKREFVTVKSRLSAARTDLDTLFLNLNQIFPIHTSFLKDLKDRKIIWGPTQLIGDVFNNLYTKLTIYKQFMMNHVNFVMLFDTLYKIPTFEKFIEANLCKRENNIAMDSFKRRNDVLHYIDAPLHRLGVYISFLKKITRYSDSLHLDYYNLLLIYEKFKLLEKQWSEKVKDCKSHVLALETFLAIEDCPILMTVHSRLLLFSEFVKVDLDDLTLISDVRMYFLYNDTLIYCKKFKEKKSGTEKKFEYKGTISLSGAIVRPLSPELLGKMCEIKKPLFRIGKKIVDSNALITEAFGFELVFAEFDISSVSPFYQNFPSSTSGSAMATKRRHAIRTRTLKEQNTWCEVIHKAINATRPPT